MTTESLAFGIIGDFFYRLFPLQSVELIGVDHHAILGERVIHCRRIKRRDMVGINHDLDRNDIFFREQKITTVMRRYRHHRTSAVTGQNIIGNPELDFIAVIRIYGVFTGENAVFFSRGRGAVDLRAHLRRFSIFIDFFLILIFEIQTVDQR